MHIVEMNSLIIDPGVARLLAQLPLSATEEVLAGNPSLTPRVAAQLSRRSPRVIWDAVANHSLPSVGAKDKGGRKSVSPAALAVWAGREPYSATELRGAWRTSPKDQNREEAQSTPRRPSDPRQRSRHSAPAPQGPAR